MVKITFRDMIRIRLKRCCLFDYQIDGIMALIDATKEDKRLDFIDEPIRDYSKATIDSIWSSMKSIASEYLKEKHPNM
jgi:hypothetical protein